MDVLSELEEKIITFIGEFGRTYTSVLGKTFFENEQQAINKIHKIQKKGFLQRVPTKLIKPRNAIVLTKVSKKYLKEHGKTVKENRGAISHINHNMIEQIAFFHLSKLGDVIRTSVWHHQNVYFAVPDLVLGLETMNIAIEIETTQKSSKRYKEKVRNQSKDLHETGNINRFLYVTPDKKLMKTIANNMSIWERLEFIDIDTLIKNIEEFGKIKSFKQLELLSEDEQKKIKIEKEYTELTEIAKLKNTIDKLKSEVTNKEKECAETIEEHEKKIRQKNDEITYLKTKLEEYKSYFTKQKEEQNKSFFAKIFKK